MVFLMETKLDCKRMERIRLRCGYTNGIDIAAEGSRGGLCLAWKGDIVVTVKSYSKWHIDPLIREGNGKAEWRFTGFYRSPYLKDKNTVWGLLKGLSHGNYYPWLVAGDFNEILFGNEKKGGGVRDQGRMDAFRDTLEECQLIDIGYSGTWFTWERGNLPETNIRERLDRGVANEEWISLFPMGHVQHLPYSMSDHFPLLICTDHLIQNFGRKKFHFESWWTLEESSEKVIKEAWETSSESLMEKLECVQSKLKVWARSLKSRRNDRKLGLAKELESLLNDERDDETMAKIIDTKIHMNLEIDKEEMYWEQRARENWLQHGDKSSAFFHKCATIRRRVNLISKLNLDDGEVVTTEAEINATATDFFKELFSSKGVANPDKVLEGIEVKTTEEINNDLVAPFQEEEIWKALKEIGPTKSPGPDGFPALFYQRYWHIVGNDVTGYCLGILNERKGVEDINNTDIVLIPKVSHPSNMVNFRPISLCSVIYKIVVKAVANRLQGVIGNCIDKVQSAFVPGRLISDNVLLAYEILHTFKKKRTGRKGFMTVKVDMSKAYDRVEWDFLKKIMLKMGFAESWVDLIMKCISTVSYSVITNGGRGSNFKPARGLRQGDPLNPFLFLICSEGLSSLMRLAKVEGLIKGARASRRGPEISHLLFADDCILFGEATDKGARILRDILKEYEGCSCQCINFNKSIIFFSANTSNAQRDETSLVLGVRSSTCPKKYLGLPNVVGRRKKESFQNLIDRIMLKIDGWSTRLLSQGGKEVFIKSVLQSIPTYAMSCFLLPKVLCEKIDRKITNYWWQKGKGKRGIHWCQWKHLCRSKEEGGLGFRNMAQFNIALLAKQGWRLLTYLDSLVAQVFKAKYYPHGDFLHSRLGSSGSYVWRSLWSSRAILEKGIFWRVGTGRDISVTNDAWIPNCSIVNLATDDPLVHIDKVSDLIISHDRKWDRDLIENTFPAEIAEQIIRIPLALEPHEDLRVWRGELSGDFSVRSAYKLLQQFEPTVYALQTSYKEFYKKLWRIDLPLKVKLLIWKISWNYLPTKVNLACRRVTSNTLCPRCGQSAEDMNHLFRECPVSKAVWRNMSDPDFVMFPEAEFIEWLTRVLVLLSLEKCRLYCGLLWVIWEDRNSRMHNERGRSSQEMIKFVIGYIKELDELKSVEQKTMFIEKKWRPPPGQMLKINFDGAFEARRKRAALGVVVRDRKGRILLSKSELYNGVESAFAAEALACRLATITALERSREEVIIERDSMSIIKKCNNPEFDKLEVGVFIQDIQGMKSKCRCIRFEYTPRKANNLAHILATETMKRGEEVYLFDGVPSYAEGQARDDSEREPD
ncbi:reverse transcriptase [Gossypium australe]|uniref:Reverse transcriptase n=1 Tax=Gossypium australe TaxID=47621 RepID=A0A5B6VEN5_9ROSI|nr:reverse transcriptase [Gossypium australe]